MKILEKFKGKVNKLGLTALLVLFSSGLVNAGYFDNVTAIMNEIPDLFPPILLIVIALFPIIVVMILINFMTGLFDGILGGIKGRIRVL